MMFYLSTDTTHETTDASYAGDPYHPARAISRTDTPGAERSGMAGSGLL